MREEYKLVFGRSIVGPDGTHIPAEKPRAYSISVDNIGSDMCPSYRTGIIRELFHRFLVELEKEDDESADMRGEEHDDNRCHRTYDTAEHPVR